MVTAFNRLIIFLTRHLVLIQLFLILCMLAGVAISLKSFFAIIYDAQNVPTSSSIVTSTASLPSVGAVGQLGWFGTSVEQPNVPASSTAVAAQLELRGISKSQQRQLAGAFIAEKGKPENYYHIGDALPESAGVLETVFDDHVVIRNGQTLSTLNFVKTETGSAQSVGGTITAPSIIMPPVPSPPLPMPQRPPEMPPR